MRPMEAHTTQIRSNLESDARGFAAEFQRALSKHAQQTLALGKQELAIQVDQANLLSILNPWNASSRRR